MEIDTLLADVSSRLSTVEAERDRLRALMMTLMDIASEAGAAHQSYDFKARAASVAEQAKILLAGGGQ